MLAVVAAIPGGCADLGELRPGATSILEVFSGPTIAEAAADAIDPYDPDKRYRGTLFLAMQEFGGEPVYMQVYLDNLRDSEPTVRAAAARALGRHGEPVHVPLLIETLKDKDQRVRLESARALQRVHNPVAVGPLLTAIVEPDPRRPDSGGEEDADVRAEAAHALGQYRTEPVVQGLIAALSDRSLAVNRNALESLRTLTGQDFGYDTKEWFDWGQSASDLFAAGRPYVFPVYWREARLIEYIPFVPRAPNEQSGTPAGMAIAPPPG